jgi:hypothetical protein
VTKKRELTFCAIPGENMKCRIEELEAPDGAYNVSGELMAAQAYVNMPQRAAFEHILAR